MTSARERAFDALDEPQKRGDAAEAVIKAAFLIRDLPVLVPENDNEPYDIVDRVLDPVYLVDVEEAPTTGMNIRWAETKNNQATRVNWHADYGLDAMLEGL